MDYQSGTTPNQITHCLNNKKAIRKINNSKYNAHTDPILAAYKILKIQELYKLASVRLIKKTLTGDTPQKIRLIFHTQTQERPTRYPNNIMIQGMRGRISYDIPTIWNNLPEELKSNNTSLKHIMKTLKTDAFSSYSNFNCQNNNCNSCNNN